MELYDNFSDKSKLILEQAFTEVRSMNMNYVGSEHLLLSLLKVKSDVIDKVKRYNQLTYKDVKKECLRYVGIGLVQREIQGYSRRATEILKLATFESNSLKSLQVEPEHILLALLDHVDATAVKVVEKIGFSAFDLKSDVIRELSVLQKNAKKAKKEKIEASLLSKFGVDMTELAKANKYDPLIGRSLEVERVIQILGRRSKNNPCLIGEPGVGKTAIVEGVAQMMIGLDVPDYLMSKKLISVNLAALLAGSKFRGEFEDRLTQLITEVKESKNIILFVDEIHTLVGAGATQGSMDAANILKPFLSRDDIQLIGATTIVEYRKYIEKDTALERRLQPVMVHEPSSDECIEMLMGIKGGYETYHNIKIEDDAIEVAVLLSTQYINDRYLPDKAIDLIDEASSRCRLNKVDVLKPEMIFELVALWTGIPLGQLSIESTEQLLKLQSQLSKRVIGQPLAVSTVSKTIMRARVGLNDEDKPLGSFIFLGTTGVGKTELAKTLAFELFGKERDLLRFDMSEYMEKHAVTKLIGSPPGYVAYEEGGQLTEKIRTKPFSVILFDELEKGHPDVLNLLFQLLDEGSLTDSKGRQVSFKQCIIIFTSNIGVDKITKKSIGFGSNDIDTDNYIQFEESLKQELKSSFKSEFLNRIDEIVVFQSLEESSVYAIIDRLLDKLYNRVGKLNYILDVDDAVKKRIYEAGYSKEYGVRSIKRCITRLIENPLSEHLLMNKPESNSVLKICFNTENGINIQ